MDNDARIEKDALTKALRESGRIGQRENVERVEKMGAFVFLEIAVAKRAVCPECVSCVLLGAGHMCHFAFCLCDWKANGNTAVLQRCAEKNPDGRCPLFKERA